MESAIRSEALGYEIELETKVFGYFAHAQTISAVSEELKASCPVSFAGTWSITLAQSQRHLFYRALVRYFPLFLN